MRHNDGGNYHERVWLHEFCDLLIIEVTDTREFQSDTESLDLLAELPDGGVVCIHQGCFDRKINRLKSGAVMTFRDGEMSVLDGALASMQDVPSEWWM